MPINNRVLVLAPHTDDGELGCGGTISRMVEEGREVYYAAFSTAAESVPPPFPPNILEKEVREGTKVLGIPAANLLVYKYRVRHLPDMRQEILEELVRMKREIDPATVFLPSAQDLHQDHQTIHLEGLRAFKMVTVLGYELPWNNLSFDYRHFCVLTRAARADQGRRAALLPVAAASSVHPRGFYLELGADQRWADYGGVRRGV